MICVYKIQTTENTKFFNCAVILKFPLQVNHLTKSLPYSPAFKYEIPLRKIWTTQLFNNLAVSYPRQRRVVLEKNAFHATMHYYSASHKYFVIPVNRVAASACRASRFPHVYIHHHDEKIKRRERERERGGTAWRSSQKRQNIN